MQGGARGDWNRTIWGDSSVKWKPGQSGEQGLWREGSGGITGGGGEGGVEPGDLMRQMGTGTQASTGVSRRWSCGVGATRRPFPSRFELDAFAAPSRQGRAREQISSGHSRFHMARRDGSLWTVAALVLNEKSLNFLGEPRRVEGVG